MRRREVLAGLAATALPAATRAQQSTKLARIGFLGPAPAANFAPRVDALRVGFRELGYTEGKDLTFSFRWWEAADQLPELAAELVRAEVDVLFAPSSAETAVFLAATKTLQHPWRPGRHWTRREPRAAGWQCHRADDAPYRAGSEGT